MSWTLFAVVLLLLGSAWASADAPTSSPWQTHLSYFTESTYCVTWVSFTQSTPASLTLTDRSSGQRRTTASTVESFVDSVTTRYVHRAVLAGLVSPGACYQYQMSEKSRTSPQYSFCARATGAPLQLAFFADMGAQGSEDGLEILRDYAANQKLDMLVHAGDFAYNLDDNDGAVGDEWFALVEPLAAAHPYQVAIGNHEAEAATTLGDYRARFSMPNYAATHNMHSSFDVPGLAHFVMVNTEAYFEDTADLGAMYAWLEADLTDYNAEKRASMPWLIVVQHRPLYCSALDSSGDKIDKTCRDETLVLRDGVQGNYSLEQLYYSAGVDFVLQGHVHATELSGPCYQNQLMGGATSMFANPRAPTYIISGAMGSPEGLHNMSPVGYGPCSLTRASVYGFGHMVLHNATHASVAQLDSGSGATVFSFEMVQEHHGPF